MLDACGDFWLGGGRAVRPRNLDSSDTRILEDSKKDIGGSSTGGLEDWTLEA